MGRAAAPVAVLQMHAIDGPGYLEHFLHDHAVPWRLLRIYAGDPVPKEAIGYRAIAVLGGPTSANDDLSYLRTVEALLRAAVRDDVPVLGHCLGGQLLARALGAVVAPVPVPEIGWTEIVADDPRADAWFGAERFPMFEWHYDGFELPPGAIRIATNGAGANQAFLIGERHLGMQFHCEITSAKIARWLDPGGLAEIEDHRDSPAVQDAARIQAGTAAWLDASRVITSRIYTRWLRGK